MAKKKSSKWFPAMNFVADVLEGTVQGVANIFVKQKARRTHTYHRSYRSYSMPRIQRTTIINVYGGVVNL